MKIVVYTKPGCVQCIYTKNELEKKYLNYQDIDVTKDRDAERDVRAMGFSAMPVVIVSHAHGGGVQRWAGLKLDKLRSLANGPAPAV